MSAESSPVRSGLVTVFLAIILSGTAAAGITEVMLRSRRPEPSPVQSPQQQDVIRQVVHEESQITQTVQRADDAVVSVIISKDLPVVERYYEEGGSPFGGLGDMFGNDFFDQFNFQVPRYRQNGTEKKEVGGGTAFFIDSSGLLLTNRHVVSDEEAEYTVLLNDERKLPATVVARDPGNDIAILQVEGDDFPSLSLSDDDIVLGQSAISIGNALGEFRNTVSVGVISGLKRSIVARGGGQSEQLESIIQTDAAINSGNSGGPLLNIEGDVIGMNTAVAAGAQNIGFAIPASDLNRAIESYRQHGKILKAFLGVRYMLISTELQEKNNLPYDYGVLIIRGEDPTDLAVIPGSPANKAGIVENDIILEVDGEKITPEHHLAGIVGRKNPGDTILLKIFHEGEEKEVKVVLGEQE